MRQTKDRSSVDSQVLDDVLLIRVERGVVPEVVSLVLHPKGNVLPTGRVQEASPQGTTHLAASWKPIFLWERNAEDLFAINDVGLVPWIPLTRFDGPPEALLTRCRDRIEALAGPREREALLVVAQLLAAVAHRDRSLLAIFGGERAMIESPLLDELKATFRHMGKQEMVLSFLSDRFGPVPEDIAATVKLIRDDDRLTMLGRFANTCPDLDAFRARLTAPAA